MANFFLRRGLDIPIEGYPKQQISEGQNPKYMAVKGTDYNGLKPKMLVSEGDLVEKGSPLFCDKDYPDVIFVSPCKGHVHSINRGEKRALLSVIVKVENLEAKSPNYIEQNKLLKSKKEFVKKCLLDSGLWTSFLTRPYSKIPNPNSKPSSIFITALDTEPLSPDADIIIKDSFDAFKEGVKKVALLTEGKVFVCCQDENQFDLDDCEVHGFNGPHPSGLVGTHVHFLDAPNTDKTVWTIGYQDIISIGKLFLSGYLQTQKIISICGPLAKDPRLIRTYEGASLKDLLHNEFLNDDACRIISGSVLSGEIAEGELSFLGKYSRQVTLIHEDRKKISFGWIKPQPRKYSVMPVLISAFRSSKLFNLTSNLNGGRRAMVPTGVFETLMPQDFLPTQLLRSLLVMDTDTAQLLGALELAEEDLALSTFACPAKYEYGSALRDCLNKIEREG